MINEQLERRVIDLAHYTHNENIVIETLLEIHNRQCGIKMTKPEFKARVYDRCGYPNAYHVAYRKVYNVPEHAILPQRSPDA